MERKTRKPASAASSARKTAAPSDRVNAAINGLIHHLIPEDPHEDEETTLQRQTYCANMVRSILET